MNDLLDRLVKVRKDLRRAKKSGDKVMIGFWLREKKKVEKLLVKLMKGEK